MRLFTIATAAATMAVGSPGIAQARPADCFVRIDGLTVIDGPCDFRAFGGDGSFQVMTLDGGYFAQVLMTRPGQGEGYWNEARWADHAHTPLGTLLRQEACWSNGYATVCAR